LPGRTHYSDSFSPEADSRTTASVVVGGYEDLSDLTDVTTTIEITPNPNQPVNLLTE
jgi:hypothetical protein